MKIRVVYLIASSLLCWNLSFGQGPENIDDLTVGQLKSAGKNAVLLGSTYSAIDFYKKYLEFRPGNFKVTNELAGLYKKTRDYVNASEVYNKAFELNKKCIDCHFNYALMLKMQGQYDDAETIFDEFYPKFKKHEEFKNYRKRVELEIEGCRMADSLINNPELIKVEHLDNTINKAHVEFSPIPLSKDKLIYGSFTEDSIKYYDAEKDTLPQRGFFLAQKENDKWTGKGPFSLNDGFEKLEGEFGNGCFSVDKKKFFFTKCAKNFRNEIVCALYMCEYKQKSWSKPWKLNAEINDPKYTNTQPAVGVDPKTGKQLLYFVSNRPKGKGGLDIWYTYYDRKNKIYRAPKNVGKGINTFRDEMTPFVDPKSNTMYFSSDGWPSMGGLDVLKIDGARSEWGVTKNMGVPLNTSTDDLFYARGREVGTGFLVSNRPGGFALKSETCCDDIYSFELIENLDIKFKGNVVELDDEKNIREINDSIDMSTAVDPTFVDSAEIELFEVHPKFGLVSLECVYSDPNGNFELKMNPQKEYQIVSSRGKFLSSRRKVSTKKVLESTTISNVFGLMKKEKNKSFVVENIYYDFDSAVLKDTSKVTIDNTIFGILSENLDIVVELSSHTDSKGNDIYNQNLSQQRAESVVQYLISKGIGKERLVAKGYGEQLPIASNENPDGTDNPEGRQKNRRTEFKIIGTLDGKLEVN